MSQDKLELQLDWDVSKLHGRWPSGPDNVFMLQRMKDVTVEETARGARGRVLEVAASEAILSCRLGSLGLDAWALDPSAAMLERAAQRMVEHGTHVTRVRGIAESLPFRDGSFDRVLCDSAIDHLADPDAGIREMARLLAPDGRLVIGAVNYDSPNVRLSRAIYRLQRRMGWVSEEEHLFWDSPVPIEHTFECTYDLLVRLCGQVLDLDRAVGISVGWMFPGWGVLLSRLSARRAFALLGRLDAVARRSPRIADYVLTVWKPRSNSAASSRQPTAADDGLRVRRGDIVYEIKIAQEEGYWSRPNFSTVFDRTLGEDQRAANLAFTGDERRSWLDDLIARGPFRDAAMLGVDGVEPAARWLRARASDVLDVFDLSQQVLDELRAALREKRAEVGSLRGRLRATRADLNFAELATDAYDAIWSSGCLHHLVNLEDLFARVERALRSGGLFAFHSYVGERRLQYRARRLALANQLLERVPAAYRRTAEPIAAPRSDQLSPFCAVRSEEILTLTREHFDVVHEAVAGFLFPLPLYLDMPALARERPDLMTMLAEAEDAARADPAITGCAAYVVARKRS